MIGYLIRALIRLDLYLHGEAQPSPYASYMSERQQHDYEVMPPHTGLTLPTLHRRAAQSSGTPDADVIVNLRYRINQR